MDDERRDCEPASSHTRERGALEGDDAANEGADPHHGIPRHENAADEHP